MCDVLTTLNDRLGVGVLLALSLVMSACSRQPEFDIVISGGTVYDGTGADGRRADVGVKGDRIAAIGNLSGRRTSDTIDASGKAVAPGFIDAHGQSGLSLLADGFGESHLRQGITSEIIGDNSPAFWTAPTADTSLLGRYGVALDWNGLDGYFQKLESRGTAINVGSLVPTSRARAEGSAPAFVEAAMRAGALGVIDDASDAGDPAALADIAGRYHGVFMSSVKGAVPASDRAATIIAQGQHARAIVVADLMTIRPADEPSTAAVVRALASATQRGLPAYGTAAPYADAGESSDTPARTAFRQWGGLMVGTNTTGMIAGAEGATRAAFGAFPRFLGQWVREEHVLALPAAIQRITSLPAGLFDIQQRGIIREKYFADLVVFDPAAVADRSSDQKPDEYPAGITHVIVNGVVTLRPDGLTGARAGHRLPGFGARRPPG
jgi:hypothetical protein